MPLTLLITTKEGRDAGFGTPPRVARRAIGGTLWHGQPLGGPPKDLSSYPRSQRASGRADSWQALLEFQVVEGGPSGRLTVIYQLITCQMNHFFRTLLTKNVRSRKRRKVKVKKTLHETVKTMSN